MRDRRREAAARRRARARRRAVAGWLFLFLVLVAGVGWALAQPRLGRDQPTEAERAAQERAILNPVNVVFREGLRREEMAAIVARQTEISSEAYLAATAPGALGRRLAETDRAVSLEGFLFPATYEVNNQTTARDLVDRQLRAFRDSTAGIDYGPAAARNLTPYEVLTIAAMVEREVQVPDERPLVAGVIYNRLRAGMTLGIDATVQYAVGEWKSELTVTDLDIDSPYNTRKFLGLPPGPIANPGLASIIAAADPAEHDFHYYVARADGTGRHYFARDADGFEQAVAQARANAG